MTPEQIEALKWRMVLDLAPNGDHTNFSGAEMLVMGRLIDHLAATGRLLPDGYVAVPETVMLDYESRLDMIRYLLPLAKGYVHANAGIRSTECIIEDAEATIAAAKGE